MAKKGSVLACVGHTKGMHPQDRLAHWQEQMRLLVEGRNDLKSGAKKEIESLHLKIRKLEHEQRVIKYQLSRGLQRIENRRNAIAGNIKLARASLKLVGPKSTMEQDFEEGLQRERGEREDDAA